MQNGRPSVGEFSFGSGKIAADRTGLFWIDFENKTRLEFDFGEILQIRPLLPLIRDNPATASEVNPRTFWRTDGSKIIEVYMGEAAFRPEGALARLGLWPRQRQAALAIRAGGVQTGFVRPEEVNRLIQSIDKLTTNPPYPGPLRLLNVFDERQTFQIVHTEVYPFDNRYTDQPRRETRNFEHQTGKQLAIKTLFGDGRDYFIRRKLEERYGMENRRWLEQSLPVQMSAEPKQLKDYRIIWKVTQIEGTAVFEINGVREFVIFTVTEELRAEVSEDGVGTALAAVKP